MKGANHLKEREKKMRMAGLYNGKSWNEGSGCRINKLYNPAKSTYLRES